MRSFALVAFAACLVGPVFAPAFAPAFADDTDPPFAASRPGETEGPIAVPKGYFQAETEIASFAHDRSSGVKSNAISLAASSLRYGLPADFDAELILQPYLRTSFSSAGIKDHSDGFGDATIRVLKNLMGQDGKGPSLAIIGYVTLPTATHGFGAPAAQPGAIVTGGVPLADGWATSWTVGVERLAEGGDQHQAEFSGALQLSHSFTDKIGAYVELAGVRDEHDVHTAATADLGATFAIGPTTQLDAGVNLGITSAADNANLFVGWAHRF
jgi:Putative MetA-pathway of phenol degradation